MKPKSKAFETALSIIHAEVLAEQLGEKLKPAIEKPVIVEKPVPAPKPITRIVDMSNQQIEKEQVLLDLQDEGVLEKLLIRSPSQNFTITLTTEKTTMQGSYTHFEDVLAYREEDTYVLEVTNIEFRQKIRLTLAVTEPITFSRIFLKYATVSQD